MSPAAREEDEEEEDEEEDDDEADEEKEPEDPRRAAFTQKCAELIESVMHHMPLDKVADIMAVQFLQQRMPPVLPEVRDLARLNCVPLLLGAVLLPF